MNYSFQLSWRLEDLSKIDSRIKGQSKVNKTTWNFKKKKNYQAKTNKNQKQKQSAEDQLITNIYNTDRPQSNLLKIFKNMLIMNKKKDL